METQVWIWYREGRLRDARSEALRALEIYEKLGAVNDVVECRELLRMTEQAMGSQSAGELDSVG